MYLDLDTGSVRGGMQVLRLYDDLLFDPKAQ